MGIDVIYDHYHGCLWRAWNVRFTARLRAAYPRTNGLQIYVHNWIVCGRDATASAHAAEIIRTNWAEWRRISARGKREYDRTQHKTHGATFRPLWCDYCQKVN